MAPRAASPDASAARRRRPADRLRALQPQLRPPRRRRGRPHRRGPRRRDEPDHHRATSATRRSSIAALRRARRSASQHPLRRRADGSFERYRLGHGDHRDRGQARRHPRAALAARDRARRHRRAGQPHGRAVRRSASSARSARGAGSTPSRRRRRSTTCSTSGCSTPRRRPSSTPTRSTRASCSSSAPIPRSRNRGHNATETFKSSPTTRRARSSSSIRARPRPRARPTRHLRVRPGTDVYLLLGDGGRHRARRARRRDVRRRAHRRASTRCATRSARVDVAEMAARCGLDAAAIVETARGFARRRVGGDLLRPRRRAGAVLDADLLPDARPARADRQRRPRGRQRLPRDVPAAGAATRAACASPSARSPRAFRRSARSATRGMFSPTLVPEEILLDHPERIRARRSSRASNPLLSYSDTRALARGARAARPAGGDRPGDDRDRARSPTTCCRRRAATRSGRSRPSRKALPGDLRAGAAAGRRPRRPKRCPSRRSTSRLAEAMGLFGAAAGGAARAAPRTRSTPDGAAGLHDGRAAGGAPRRRERDAHLLELPRARPAPARARRSPRSGCWRS